jgi:hypothetical protein
MHRLPSGGLGRDVWPAAPPDESRQERLGQLSFVRPDRLNPLAMFPMKRIDQGPSAVRLRGGPPK